jgi:hypothetical protein
MFGEIESMKTSGSYVVVETMMRQHKIMLFELKHLVDSLERRGLITPPEHRSLMRLGERILPKVASDAA